MSSFGWDGYFPSEIQEIWSICLNSLKSDFTQLPLKGVYLFLNLEFVFFFFLLRFLDEVLYGSVTHHLFGDVFVQFLMQGMSVTA